MSLAQNGFLDGIFVCAKLVFFGWNILKNSTPKTFAKGGYAPPPQQRTTHNTTHHRGPWPSQHRQTMAAAAASSNISGPTAPTLPTAWSLIDYAIGYKDMQQLSTMEQYLQSYGQARFGG